jgi:S1-C subfamily serine protease
VVDINTEVQGGAAAGTGLILTSSGEVLTNNHVISGATNITVTLTSNSRIYHANVVGSDPAADVALIQLQGASGLPTVTIADSSTLSVGQAVVAIGNALGRGGAPSVTTGSITALDQTITASDGNGPGEQLSGLIESDAPISPGDSGGALVNTSGQVIGMITAGQSQGFRRRAATTVGYAITSTAAIAVVNQIRSGAPSTTIVPGSSTAYLGVQVRNLDAATASRLGLPDTAGALVIGVVAGSPAAGLGIAPDAVITGLDGKAVASADGLGPLIRAHKSGDTVRVTWIDGSGTHTRSTTLG